MTASNEENLVKYEASDRPPHRLAAALGAQVVALIVAGIVLTPVVVLRAAEAPQSVAAWVIFMALLVSGLVTMLQAAPVWRIGAGYVLFMGTSGAFISVSVSAIQAGGHAFAHDHDHRCVSHTVSNGIATWDPAQDHHADSGWHCNHAHWSHSNAHRVRYAQPCARGQQ